MELPSRRLMEVRGTSRLFRYLTWYSSSSCRRLRWLALPRSFDLISPIRLGYS